MNTNNYKKEIEWLTTDSDKKLSLMAMGICCIFVGGVANSLVGLSAMGYLFNVVGVGSITYDVYNKSNPHKQFFENLGLYVGRGVEKLYPRLKKRIKTSYGESLRFYVPDGLCTEDFKKNKVAFQEYFKADNVEIKFSNGFIFVELHRDKLEELYQYQAIETNGILEIPIGYSLSGLIKLDLTKAPHLLIAGETGSGKSTVLRVIITFLIQMKSIYKIKLHLIDLKEGVEFSLFRKSSAVATFSKNREEAEKVLRNLLKEVKRRYELFYQSDCVDIGEYNKNFKSKKLSYEVAIVDEFADLQNEKDSISSLEELLAKARACGIHFIISTQRPDAKILNGRLKANVPYIIGLKTMNEVNSRIIIDQNGLEGLRGNGHCIIKTDKFVEGQCFYLSANEARDIVKGTYVDAKINGMGTFIPKQKKQTKKVKKAGEVKDFRFLEVLAGGRDD